MKKLWRKIRHWFKGLLQKAKTVAPLGLKPVPWNEAVHASCWNGASRRMMNILSAKFSDGKFAEYVAWMKSRGCDTAHVILINARDGERAGYNCALDANQAALAKTRIETLRREGFAIIPWIITDDSSAWAKDLFDHAEARIKTLADAGLFDLASYVVLGLEMDEANSYQDGGKGWPKVAAAVRKHFRGKLGVHHKSGNTFRYASLGDIVLGQLEPNAATDSTIRAQIKAIKKLGKAAVGFEYSRTADRNKSKIALAAGAIGIGNW